MLEKDGADHGAFDQDPAGHQVIASTSSSSSITTRTFVAANGPEIMLDGCLVAGPLTAATVGTVVSTTLRISAVAYELKAVGENARDLLDSTKLVSNNLQTARTLRRQKSIHFDTNEKKWIDSVLASTDKTLSNVAALIEPARVDMQTKFGGIGLVNRGLFVFRDSPKVQTHLARLSIASGSLNAVLNILCDREGRSASMASMSKVNSWPDPAIMKRQSHSSLRSEFSSPPAYQDSSRQSQLPETQPYIRRRQLLGRESAGRVISEEPMEISEEPLVGATWSGSVSTPSIDGMEELKGSIPPLSSSFFDDKTPTVQVQEVAELESPPLSSLDPTLSDLRGVRPIVDSPSFHTIRLRKSTSRFRDSVSTVASETGGVGDTSDSPKKSSGRKRGKAWMAHQAGR